MPDMLGTGLSGLRAMQRALDTTAHNISNVSTDGYTRQRVEFGTWLAVCNTAGIGTARSRVAELTSSCAILSTFAES